VRAAETLVQACAAPKSCSQTPASGVKVAGFGDMCAVCYSPVSHPKNKRMHRGEHGTGDSSDVFWTEQNLRANDEQTPRDEKGKETLSPTARTRRMMRKRRV
jgi:hypothetical protein